MAHPNILILTTGGTIAGGGKAGDSIAYQSGRISGEDLVRSIPELSKIAKIAVEEVCRVGSQDMTLSEWCSLGRRVRELQECDDVDGIVVPHGTDTMEETAFFLHLAVALKKPLILTGAVKPYTDAFPDGPANLLSAVRMACEPSSVCFGPLICMAGEYLEGCAIFKAHTMDPSPYRLRMGHQVVATEKNASILWNNEISRFGEKAVGLFKDVELGISNFPTIRLCLFHTGAPLPELKDADGLVVAGVGNGNLSEEWIERLTRYVKEGGLVVRASSVPFGPVIRNREIDDDATGFIVSGKLSAVQSRVLLLLAGNAGLDAAETQKVIDLFG